MPNQKTTIPNQVLAKFKNFWKIVASLNNENLFLIYSIIVILGSFFVFFFNFQNPPQPIWDENYHIASAQKYIDRVYFQEPHPPTGKLLIALGEKIFNPNENINRSSFTETDFIQKFPDGYSFAGVRFFPSLLAFLSGYIFFLILLVISKNLHLSFIFSWFYLFDNAMSLHFKGAMLDGILVFFVLLSLFLFYIMQTQKLFQSKYYALLGAIVALAVTTKVNTLILLLLPIFLLYVENQPNFSDFKKRWVNIVDSILIKTLYFSLAFVVIFLSIFNIHSILGKNLNPNLQYNISSVYKEAVEKNKLANPYFTLVNIEDWLNYSNNYTKGVPALDVCKTDENGSYPLFWPVGNKSISYRWERYFIEKGSNFTYNLFPEKNTLTLEEYNKLTDSEKSKYEVVMRYLYLQSNPVVWLVSLLGVLLGLVLLTAILIFKLPAKNRFLLENIAFLEFFYFAYMIPVLNVNRVLYLYHYFVPLIIGLIIGFLLVLYIFEGLEKPTTKKVFYIGLITVILLALACFIFFLPFSHNLPLTESQFKARNWFSFWQIRSAY